MNGNERRTHIINELKQAKKEISATALAQKFAVSRQVIVQDIALLRTAGYKITALARGYIMETGNPYRVFKVVHNDDDVQNELNIIVDFGGCIEDVFIFHKVYGTIKAPLNIRTRNQVDNFIKSLASGSSSLLKNVTSNYHYHTVTADSEQTLDKIEQALNCSGFLAPLQEYEPSDLKK